MNEVNNEVRIGNIFGSTGGNHAGMVYDKFGLAPTLLAMTGGYRQPIIVEVIKNNKPIKMSDNSSGHLIKLGSIPTKNGIMDKQGYNVYSVYGCANTITNDSGGPGHNKGGLFLVVKKT